MRSNPIRRMIIGGLAAYALIAHALIMGLVHVPTAAAEDDVLAALRVICSPSAHLDVQDVPGPSPAHAQHCALCGLGHATLPAPDRASLSAPRADSAIAWISAEGEALLQRARMREQQPRGPPHTA